MIKEERDRLRKRLKNSTIKIPVAWFSDRGKKVNLTPTTEDDGDGGRFEYVSIPECSSLGDTLIQISDYEDGGHDAGLVMDAINALPKLLDVADRLDRLDRVESEYSRLKEREAHFANALAVADGGQYRADWDGAIARLVKERDAYRQAKQENDERFMRERDEARQEAEKYKEELRNIKSMVASFLSPTEKNG